MVGKVERGLMALFEPIVLAFLIDFSRALTFKPDSEADFSRFWVESNGLWPVEPRASNGLSLKILKTKSAN